MIPLLTGCVLECRKEGKRAAEEGRDESECVCV